MIEDGARIIWEVGDRVARDHWRGTVVEVAARSDIGNVQSVRVQWDHGVEERYYEHAIEPEEQG